MKRAAVAPLLLLAILTIHTHAAAQNPSPPRSLDYPVKVEYDRFADRTDIYLNYTLVQGEARDGLELSALAVHSGNKMAAPINTIMLSVASFSKDWRYLESSRTLRVIADGERLNLGEMDRRSSVVKRGFVVEFLAVIIPKETFLKIANSEKVEMQLGRIEFELKPEMLGYMKDFAKLLNPR